MRYCIILFICAAAFAAPTEDQNYLQHSKDYENELLILFKNPIDKLWEQALEFIRTLLKTYEPFEVPQMPEQTVTGDGISLKATFNHVKISKASDFTIDHIENNVLGLWAKFNVTIPQMHIEGEYKVSGTVNGKSVKSSQNGHFVIDVDQLKTGGYIKVAFKGTYLQMSQLDIGYTLNGVKFDETGLEVDGLSEEDIKKLFNDNNLLQYFRENEKFVCKQISNYVMETANKIMYDKSLQGLLQWLKDVIDGKIVPTPPS